MTRPSKLWRTLGATQSVFQVGSNAHGDVFYYDDRISSISLTRGTTMAGLSTAGGSFTLAGKAPRLRTDTNDNVRISFTPYGRYLLNSLGIALDTGGVLSSRFYGRVTGQTVTDLGNDRYTTTVDVQDWAALLSQLDKGAAVLATDPGIDKLIDSLFNRADIPAGPLTKWGSSWHLVRGDAVGGFISFSTADTLSLIADAGIFIRTLKDGRVVVWSHDHLVDVADDWATYWPDTLLRSQVLSPAEWTQPPGIRTVTAWTKVNSVGTTVTGTATIGYPSGYSVKSQSLDLTRLQEQGDGLNDRIIAVASQGGPDLPRVEKVTIDVLGLIRRGHPTDLDTLAQLLNADHGAIVALAHDWPAEVVGVSFIQTMTETITPDTWRIELDLVPSNHVTGRPVPPVRGRTWHSAYPATTTWDGVPNDPTWDEH